MAIGDDWSIDYANKRIYYVGTGSRYTVREFYSWLMDTFDELAQMDDPVPMSASTPTDFTLLNGWFIPYDDFHFLKGGSIATSGWDADSYDGGIVKYELSETGYTDCVASDIGKTVTGSVVGDFGVLLDYDNTNRIWWVRVDTAGTYETAGNTISVSGGSGSGTVSTASTGENLWSNAYTLGTIENDTNIYIYYGTYPLTSSDELPFFWGLGHVDILVLIKETDTLKASGYITVFARNYGDYFDFFEIDISGGGRNPVPLATSTDIDNQTTASTINNYTDIIIAQVNGKLNYTSPSGTFEEWETITGGTSGATAIVLYNDTDNNYLILGQVEGTFQDGETITGGTSGASATVSGTLDVSVTTLDQDLNNGNGPQPYDIHINCAGRTLSQVYEYMKYITAKPYYFSDYVKYYDGSSYNDRTTEASDYTADDVELPPQSTGSEILYIGSPDKFNLLRIAISTPGDHDYTINFEYWDGSAWTSLTVSYEPMDINNFKETKAEVFNISFTEPGDWATTDVDGTTAYWIRITSTGGTTITTAPKARELWIGYGPQWYIIQNNGSSNYTTYGEVYKYAQTTYTPVKQAPFGQYLGGTFFGARGVWIENMDASDVKNYQLKDSNDVIQVPPNIVAVTITSVESGDRVAVFRLTAAGGEINKQRYQLAYIHEESTQFYNADTATYTDETDDAAESTADDVYLPPQQSTTAGDAIYFGADYKFSEVRINVTTAGSYSDITINWEYWNGSAWTSLTVTDNTNGFTVSGTNEVTFTPPADWAKTTVNGVQAYYIRAVTTFGASPSITTAPLAGEVWVWHNYNGSGVVAVGSNISSDEPQSSTVRVVNADGTDDRYVYDSWSGQRFVLNSSTPLSKDYSENQYVYVPIIDEEATSTSVTNTLVYSADIPVLVRVRKYGIQPFQVESTITDVGLTVSAIRTPDNVVL